MGANERGILMNRFADLLEVRLNWINWNVNWRRNRNTPLLVVDLSHALETHRRDGHPRVPGQWEAFRCGQGRRRAACRRQHQVRVNAD